MNDEILSRLFTMDIDELFMWYNKELNEDEEDIDEDIENGKKLKIPIYYFTYGWYKYMPEIKMVKVRGFGKYELKDFEKEKMFRMGKMQVYITEKYKEDTLLERRK